MGVAIGRGIDDDLEAFGRAGQLAACCFTERRVAILCADIDGGIGRRSACCDIAEFARVIG